MQKHYAKKSLGQNFLKSERELTEIITAGELSTTDVVLEIGPGKGALTSKILATGAKVMAVEKDTDLIPYLSELFAKEIKTKQLTLVHDDILTWNRKEISKKKYKIIANIPYYITGAIIRNFLETPHMPTHMVLLVQKEVAERIIARDGKESILSLSIKAYGEPKMIAKVPRGAFAPAPSVDSAILAIKNITKKQFGSKTLTEKAFFDILHAGFAHKRKRLFQNLTSYTNKITIAQMFETLKLDPNIRAEDIAVETWIQIGSLLRK